MVEKVSEKWSFLAKIRLKLGQNEAKMGQNWVQKGSKWGPKGSKWVQVVPQWGNSGDTVGKWGPDPYHGVVPGIDHARHHPIHRVPPPLPTHPVYRTGYIRACPRGSPGFFWIQSESQNAENGRNCGVQLWCPVVVSLVVFVVRVRGVIPDRETVGISEKSTKCNPGGKTTKIMTFSWFSPIFHDFPENDTFRPTPSLKRGSFCWKWYGFY